jgi:hypothetical protein
MGCWKVSHQLIRPTAAAWKIPVTVDRRSLAEADPFARRHKIARSQFNRREPSSDFASPPQRKLIGSGLRAAVRRVC